MINILFCGNDYVFDGILTTTLSILKRSDNIDPLNIYIYTMDVTHLNKNYFPISDKKVKFLEDEIKKYNSHNKITKIDVTDLYMEHFSKCPNEGAYCSPYTLIRLLADLIPGMPDKLLYLDADLMFNKDIHLLYDIDVEGYEYASARDHYGKYLINPNYINAGVLLFNMKYSKETKLFEKARNWLKKKKLVFADESALYRATSKKKMIAQKFNDQKFLWKNRTVVRHFSKRLFYLPYPHTANIKQWQVSQIHKVFHYYYFDDIFYEYIYLKRKFEEENKE